MGTESYKDLNSWLPDCASFIVEVDFLDGKYCNVFKEQSFDRKEKIVIKATIFQKVTLCSLVETYHH
jgi:hypothetical protein